MWAEKPEERPSFKTILNELISMQGVEESEYTTTEDLQGTGYIKFSDPKIADMFNNSQQDSV